VTPTLAPKPAAPLLSAPPPYSISEEWAHSLSHGLGIVVSITGLAVLVARAAMYGSAIHVVSCAIFSASLILMYTGSTIYHAVSHPRIKVLLRKVDQAMVYLLIGGSYAPLCLVTLRGAIGWSLLAVIWSLSLLGMALCVLAPERHERHALRFYLGLGWAIVLAVIPLIERMDIAGVALLFGGGLCYSIGTWFYLREQRPYFHAIWHLFVLAGTVMHYFMVYCFVIPQAPAVA
jgi:hemolysin III